MPPSATASRQLPPVPDSRLLSASPRLKTLNDLEEAVRVIALIDARKQAVEARIQAETAEIIARAEEDMTVEGLALMDVRERLVAAIESFLPEHRAEVFRGGTKTVQLRHGEISLRDKPATIALEEGTSAKTLAERWVKRHKLDQQTDDLLRGAGMDGWLRPKFELDLQSIQQRFRAGLLPKSKIPAGLTVKEATETVFIRPAG